jgi:hypothetical protein
VRVQVRVALRGDGTSRPRLRVRKEVEAVDCVPRSAASCRLWQTTAARSVHAEKARERRAPRKEGMVASGKGPH